MKVAGWARAAIAVAATTKGSIADKTWEESVFSTSAFGLIPKCNKETLPSLLCDPTLPINGEVEQANVKSAPFFGQPLFNRFIGREWQVNEE